MRMERAVAAVLMLAGIGACGSDGGNGPDTGAMMLEPGMTAGSGAMPSMEMPKPSDGMTSNPSDDPAQDPPGDDMTADPPGDDGTQDPPANDPAAMDPMTPLSDIPASCRGFEVAGLEYSPGGNVLPNTCAPFHGTFNNPYAIRCVDADPSMDTGFVGDDYCILPPEPELGTQVHVGPEDYANVDPSFLMRPMEEITDYYYTKAKNEEEHYFFRVDLRMRPGSHHMINSMIETDHEEGFTSNGEGISLGGGGGGRRSFPGAQRPDSDRPQGTLEVPPENADLGDVLNPRQQFSLNLHHFNLSQTDVLREVWINIWYKPAAEVKQTITGIAVFGNPADVSIPAGEHRRLEYSCDVPGNTRIITLNGHRHAHTTRFGVWLVKPSGDEIPLYESFDYNDMPTFQYDSISQNPVPDVATSTDGGFSGILEVSQGDKIHFVCDINNTSTSALRFANEVQTGEMCILFGSKVGDSVCGPARRVQE